MACEIMLDRKNLVGYCRLMLNQNEHNVLTIDALTKADEKRWGEYHDWLLINSNLEDSGVEHILAKYPEYRYDANKDYAELLRLHNVES